ncbi:hypothetical protein [Specibacter sp. RAF43]|uniref:hypothetical protein n=1 Tax=Specibacter sp. RAF43 TaxID=3233057 RepID=UPI003F9C05DB
MPRLNEAQIRLALQAAADHSARSGRPAARFGQTGAAGLLRRRRDALLTAALAATGVDQDKFGQLLAESNAEAARFVDAQRSAAGTRPAAAREAVRRAIDGRREALAQLPPDPVEYFALEAPFLIWPTRGMELESTHIEPWNSQAEIWLHAGNDGDSEQAGREELTFYFLWENPRDRYSVTNVDGFLVLNGFCDALGHGGILWGDRFSKLDVDVTLRLMEWWNQPPTEPPADPSQTQRAVTLSVDTGGFGDFTHVEIADVFRGYDLQYGFFTLPPHGVVVIEVSVVASYDVQDGSVDLDFSGHNLTVQCPFVQVAMLP